LRRLDLPVSVDVPELVAVFENGEYTGNGKAKKITEAIIECLGDVSTNHPCLGTIDAMVLTVTLQI
jgi:hypothetical protein